MSLRQFILNNIWLKVMSLLFAVLIWIVVQIQITGGNLELVFRPDSADTRSYSLKLHVLKTANDTRTILVTPNAVTVTVQGSRSLLQHLQASDLRAYVDFSGTNSNGASATAVVRIDLPDGANLIDVVPEEVRAEIIQRPLP